MVAALRRPIDMPLTFFVVVVLLAVDWSLRARSLARSFTRCAPRFWSIIAAGLNTTGTNIRHIINAYFREDRRWEDLRTPLFRLSQEEKWERLEGFKEPEGSAPQPYGYTHKANTTGT